MYIIILIFCIINVVRSVNCGYIISGDIVGGASFLHQDRSIHSISFFFVIQTI